MVAGACPRCGSTPPSPRKRRLHRVYHSARFKRLRLVAFARDDWACVDCGYEDETRTGAGLLADHVLPFDGPDDPLAWELENLATRCSVCSGRKDGRRR
jgi:5-methylcytosine-specific restriction endonuclease McrA